MEHDDPPSLMEDFVSGVSFFSVSGFGNNFPARSDDSADLHVGENFDKDCTSFFAQSACNTRGVAAFFPKTNAVVKLKNKGKETWVFGKIGTIGGTIVFTSARRRHLEDVGDKVVGYFIKFFEHFFISFWIVVPKREYSVSQTNIILAGANYSCISVTEFGKGWSKEEQRSRIPNKIQPQDLKDKEF